MAIQLGPRVRQVLRYVGFVVLGLVTFVFAVQATFPYDRVKDKITDALEEKYDVTIGDIERGFMPGKMTLTDVSLATRPTKADDPISKIFFKRIEISPSLLSAIRGKLSVDIDATIGVGSVHGNIAVSSSGLHLDLDGQDLPGGSLPLKEFLGLPIIGKLEIGVQLDLPNDKTKAGKTVADWSKAEGTFDFGCPSGCTFGDGKTKLKPKVKNARTAAFTGDGIDFGTVNLDNLTAEVEIKDGKLAVAKWEAKSPDGELHVDLDIALQQDLNDSMVTGCLRFKGSDELLKREPKTFAAIQTTGAPLAPDGLFHIKLDGKLRDVRRLGQVCGAAAPATLGHDDAPLTGRRPNLPAEPPPTITIEPKPGTTPPPAPPPLPPPPPPPSAPVDEQRRDAAVPPGAEPPSAGSAAGSAEPAPSGTPGPGDVRPQ